MGRFVKGAMPIVHVEWEDSMGSGGWHREHEYAEFVAEPQATCWTAGFLAKRDRKGLYVALSQNQNGSLAELLFIPRSAVRKVSIIARLAKKDGA